MSADVTAAMTAAFAAEASATPGLPAATSLPAPVAAPVAQPQVAAPAQPPVPQAQPAQSPSLQPPPAEAAPTQAQQEAVAANAINDQALYQVPQSDGTVATLSGKELREGVLRQSDYTRKTQQLAQQRQEVERVMPTLQQLQAQQQALEADLRNGDRVAEYALRNFPDIAERIARLRGPQAAPVPQGNPEEVASQGYVNQTTQGLAQQIAQLQAQLQHQQGQLQLEAQARAQAAEQAETSALNRFQVQQAKGQIDAALPGVIAAHPLITAIPNHVELLRFEVLKNYKPQTPAEAIQCFQIEANKLQTNLVNQYVASQKVQAVQAQQASLVSNGLASTSGMPVTAQQTGPRLFIGADGKLDAKAQTQSVLDFFRSQQGQ